jgi:hypothetical protein
MCSVAFDHELGSTGVEVFSHPDRCEHVGCGVYKIRVTKIKTARKEDWTRPNAVIPVRRMRHEQMKSIRAEIKKLQAFYEKVKKEKP